MFPLVPCRPLLGNDQSSQMVLIHYVSRSRLYPANERDSRCSYFSFLMTVVIKRMLMQRREFTILKKKLWCHYQRHPDESCSERINKIRDQLLKSIADWEAAPSNHFQIWIKELNIDGAAAYTHRESCIIGIYNIERDRLARVLYNEPM